MENSKQFTGNGLHFFVASHQNGPVLEECKPTGVEEGKGAPRQMGSKGKPDEGLKTGKK